MQYSDLPAEFIRTLAEHNIKIENVEKIATETNFKLNQIIAEIQVLQLKFAASNDLELRIKKLEEIADELIASKNKVVGAMTVGTIAGTIIGVIGTWVVELFRVKH